MLYMLSPQWDIYQSLRYQFRGKDVLEVGFGTGFGVVQYASFANSVQAIELDYGAIDFAKKAFPLRNVQWSCNDITVMNGAYNIYDAVIMIEALEHIEDWQLALHNIMNLLKPGGKLYMSARNRNADLRRNDLHEREWTAAELRDNLKIYFLIGLSVRLLSRGGTKQQFHSNPARCGGNEVSPVMWPKTRPLARPDRPVTATPNPCLATTLGGGLRSAYVGDISVVRNFFNFSNLRVVQTPRPYGH